MADETPEEQPKPKKKAAAKKKSTPKEPASTRRQTFHPAENRRIRQAHADR